MKILYINNFGNLRGGSDRMFIETANAMVEEKNEVAVFYSSNDSNVTKNENFNSKIKQFITFDFFSSNKNILLKTLKFIKNTTAQNDLQKVIDTFKPDIIHLHIFQSRLSSSIIQTIKKNKIKSVMTIHEYKILCPVYTHLDMNINICEKCKPFNYTPCIKNKCVEGNLFKSTLMSLESLNRDIFNSYIKNIDLFLMVSNFIQQKHEKVYSNYSFKFKQLYNFVEVRDSNLNLNYGDYLLYFGRLSKEKGIDILLDAIKLNNNIPLKIVGKGDQLEHIQQRIINENISNVELLGFKSGDELNEIIKKSRFTIVPSSWFENNPMNIIESFSFGKPVIASNIGGIPELVNNNTGFLFESKNHEELSGIIHKSWVIETNNYEKMSINCYNYAKHNFSKKNHIQKLILYYKELTLKTL
jgi:glycosyltransferase involved in cell wall biosynthesis